MFNKMCPRGEESPNLDGQKLCCWFQDYLGGWYLFLTILCCTTLLRLSTLTWVDYVATHHTNNPFPSPLDKGSKGHTGVTKTNSPPTITCGEEIFDYRMTFDVCKFCSVLQSTLSPCHARGLSVVVQQNPPIIARGSGKLQGILYKYTASTPGAHKHFVLVRMRGYTTNNILQSNMSCMSLMRSRTCYRVLQVPNVVFHRIRRRSHVISNYHFVCTAAACCISVPAKKKSVALHKWLTNIHSDWKPKMPMSWY